jgi:hypothetical protein
VTTPPTPPPPPPTPPPYYGQPGGPVGPPPGNDNTLGLVGMILGIVAIPLGCCGYFGIVPGIVGGVLSWLGLQKARTGLATNRGQALAGLICSAVAVVLGILVVITARSIDWNQLTNDSRLN